MESLNRRSFLAGVGAAAMTVGMPVAAWANEGGNEDGAPAAQFLEDDLQAYCDRGGTSLSVEELNKIRREMIDAAGDFEMEDGTVVSAVWHKLNVLTNSYGLGGPDPKTGEGMAYLQELFYHDEDLAQKYLEAPIGVIFSAEDYAQQTGRGPDPKTGEGMAYLQELFYHDEDLAQKYLEAPIGVIFSAEDYAQQTGRDLKESKVILEDLADRCLLYREHRCGMNFYYQIPWVHGFFELSINRMYDQDYVDVMYRDYYGAPSKPSLVPGGTPIYYSVPVGQDVVSDDRVAPLSDWREVVERWDKIALCPCCCSLRQNARATGCDLPEMFSPEMSDYRNVFDEHGHKLERCLALLQLAPERPRYRLRPARDVLARDERLPQRL